MPNNHNQQFIADSFRPQRADIASPPSGARKELSQHGYEAMVWPRAARRQFAWALRHVLLTLLSLTLFLGVYWIVHGIIEIVDATARRDMPARGTHVLAGAIGAVAGVDLPMPGTSLPTLT